MKDRPGGFKRQFRRLISVSLSLVGGHTSYIMLVQDYERALLRCFEVALAK
jgi:hypothetical protein